MISSSQVSRHFLSVVILIGLANFATFVAIAIHLGGDALNGHVVEGHPYLRSHGQSTEVTRAVFIYSKWHAISMLITWVAAIVATHILNERRKLPRATRAQ